MNTPATNSVTGKPCCAYSLMRSSESLRGLHETNAVASACESLDEGFTPCKYKVDVSVDGA